MGHDESQARQAALAKFVRLMKASANDICSEVEAISYTGDISALSNYELTVVISQLQAQLFSNLNPHRPSGMPTPAPEPTPATPATPAVSVVEEPAAMNLLESFEYASNQVQNLRERMEQGDRKLYRSVGEFMDSTDSTIQNLAAEALKDEPVPEPTPEPYTAMSREFFKKRLEQQILNSADGWTSNGKNEKIDLFFLFQEVDFDYDALHDALKCYSKCELARCAYKNKLAGWSDWDKNQLIEELVQFVKNQRETWAPTPAAPTPAAPAPATPAKPEPVEAWKTRMQQITKYGGASNQPTPTLAPPTPAPEPEPEPEAFTRLSLFTLFQDVGQDYDALYDELKYYTKPALVQVARHHRLAGKSALLKYTAKQLIEELVTFVKGQRESWGTPTPDWEPAPAPAPAPEPAPEPGLSWLDNPEAFTL